MLKKLSRTVKISIIVLEILLVLLIFSLVYNFFLPLGKGQRIVYFSDSNVTTVLQTLSRSGYNIIDWDKLLFMKHNLPTKGWYRIDHTDGGRYHFFNQLNRYPLATMHIKIYPGETHRELLHRLANDMKLDEKRLDHIYEVLSRYREGDIISGTYEIAKKADENQTLSFLFARSKEKRQHFFYTHHLNELDHNTMKVLLTIASIIQKETNDPEEMPLISSVIYNRLNRGMRLQMDGTLNYGDYSHCVVTPERIKNDTTFYNTYKYKGLPPAPLATVSLDALDAAMFPARSNLFYFMLQKDGGHKFSETYEEHKKYLKAFREYLKTRDMCIAEENNSSKKL